MRCIICDDMLPKVYRKDACSKCHSAISNDLRNSNPFGFDPGSSSQNELDDRKDLYTLFEQIRKGSD